MLKLVIGNKNYSSWSLRPWLVLRQGGIPFEEIRVRFDSFDENSTFKKTLSTLSPTGKVPVLIDGDLTVWDTLAIAEYLAEQYPDRQLWPQDTQARAMARSACAEMHSGFSALRGACPMNIEADLAQQGALLWRDRPAVRADVARLVQLWTELLEAHGGPMLMGEFAIVDAFYAPVCMRLSRYGLPVPQPIAQYIQRVEALPAMQEWIAAAKAEQDFREFEEPYRLKR